jgi:regulatory protein
MKITALKSQIKNVDRVSVFIDGKYSFSLTLDELIAQKLKKDQELSVADIEVLKKLSSDGKLRMRTYEWLVGRPHSTRELRDYLRRKQAEPDLTDRLVLEFTDKKILSDDRFAQWSVERGRRKNKSSKAVINELRAKGINAGEAKNAVAGQPGNDLVSISILLAKLRLRPRYSDHQKLVRYLLSKGFNYSDIKHAMSITEPEQD